MVVFPDFWVLSYRRPTEGALTTNLLSCSLSGASMSAVGGIADIATKLLTRDEARRIAANVANLHGHHT